MLSLHLFRYLEFKFHPLIYLVPTAALANHYMTLIGSQPMPIFKVSYHIQLGFRFESIYTSISQITVCNFIILSHYTPLQYQFFQFSVFTLILHSISLITINHLLIHLFITAFTNTEFKSLPDVSNFINFIK